MIRSSTSLASDDVTISCRVRRSESAENPQFSPSENMTCTMRHWSPTHSPNAGSMSMNSMPMDRMEGDCAQSPELIFSSQPVCQRTTPLRSRASDSFTPIRMRPNTSYENLAKATAAASSGKVESKSRRGSKRAGTVDRRKGAKRKTLNTSEHRVTEQEETIVTYNMYLPHILVVDVRKSVEERLDIMYITMRNSGCTEVVFDTEHSYQILLAFFRVNLAHERIVFAAQSSYDDVGSPGEKRGVSLDSCCSFGEDGGSYNADDFTASRIKERVKRESWTEKIRRKVVHVAMRIHEVSDSLNETCGGPSMCGNPCLSNDSCSDIRIPKRRNNMDLDLQNGMFFEVPGDLEFSMSHSVMGASVMSPVPQRVTNNSNHTRNTSDLDLDLEFVQHSNYIHSSTNNRLELSSSHRKLSQLNMELSKPMTAIQPSPALTRQSRDTYTSLSEGYACDPAKVSFEEMEVVQLEPVTETNSREFGELDASQHSLRRHYGLMESTGDPAI